MIKNTSEGGSREERKSVNRRGSSCGELRYSDVSEDRLSTREVGKIKK